MPGLSAPAEKQATAIVSGSAGAAIPELGALPGGQPVQAAAESAMVTAARITTLSAAAVILLGLLATIAMPATRGEGEDDSVLVAPSADAAAR